MIGTKFIVRNLASWKLNCALSLVVLSLSCAERVDDEQDHRTRSGSESNNVEGSPDGRGVAPATGPMMTFQREPLTQVSQITSSSNPDALVTQQVQLAGVPIKRVLSSQYVIIRDESDRGVVVRLKEALPDVKPGQKLNVTGMISQLGEDLAHWELDPENKKIAGEFSIFVNAIESGLSQ
jgi:hypothetical protein